MAPLFRRVRDAGAYLLILSTFRNGIGFVGNFSGFRAIGRGVAAAASEAMSVSMASLGAFALRHRGGAVWGIAARENW